MTARKLTSKAIANSASTYIGKAGEIFYDTATATLKLSDGATAGGVTFGVSGVSGLTAGSGTAFAGSTGAGMGTYVTYMTLPNQTCALGAVWRLRAFGVYWPASSANVRNLAARMTFGGMTIVGEWNLSPVPTSSSTSCLWSVEFTVTGETYPNWVNTTGYYTGNMSTTISAFNGQITGIPTGPQSITFEMAQTGTLTSGDYFKPYSATIERLI
jgi:hypothetical protein